MSLIGVLVTCLVAVMKYLGKATYTHSYRKKKVYPDSNVQFTIIRKSWLQDSEATDYIAFTSRKQEMVNTGACSNFSFLFSPGSQAMERCR